MKSVPSFDHLARAVSPGPELTRRSGSGALASPRSITEQHSPLMGMQRQGSGMPATPRATQQSHPVALGWPPELQRVATMRSVLLAHLQRSQLYDVRVVLQALRGTTLHHEQVRCSWPRLRCPAGRAAGGGHSRLHVDIDSHMLPAAATCIHLMLR
jgi:hypothetical protein